MWGVITTDYVAWGISVVSFILVGVGKSDKLLRKIAGIIDLLGDIMHICMCIMFSCIIQPHIQYYHEAMPAGIKTLSS